MKAIILCGGMGTRLREHSGELRPKPMVEVGGRPILWHIMKIYASHGITDFVLALGYKGAVIRDYFLRYEEMSRDVTVTLGRHGAVEVHGAAHEEQGWRITLVDTGESAQTGARVARALRYVGVDETFAVTYGDGVSDVDLGAVLVFHRASGALATITGVRPPGRFGELRQDAEGRVIAFAEKPQVSEGVINGGFFFFEPGFRRYLSEHDDHALEGDAIERAVRDRVVSVYVHPGYWQCMDTPRDWQTLETLWTGGRAPWRRW